MLTSWSEIFGVGVKGIYENSLYEIRSAPSELTFSGAYSSVAYFKNGNVIAVFKFGDSIFPQAREVIKTLSSKANIYLLSGDNSTTVSYVSSELGIPIENSKSEVSPESKVEFIKNLPNSMMLGDGANDASALSKASIGIAVKGSMAASLKAAKIYFSQFGIDQILKLFSISEQFEKTVNRHLWFTSIYNFTGATLAILGYINPLVAALLMPASSLTVLLSSVWGMRQLERKKQERNHLNLVGESV